MATRKARTPRAKPLPLVEQPAPAATLDSLAEAYRRKEKEISDAEEYLAALRNERDALRVRFSEISRETFGTGLAASWAIPLAPGPAPVPVAPVPGVPVPFDPFQKLQHHLLGFGSITLEHAKSEGYRVTVSPCLPSRFHPTLLEAVRQANC